MKLPEPVNWSPPVARLVGRRPSILRRVPLTLGTSLVIVVIAGYSGGLTATTPDVTIQRWGFDLNNLAHGHVLTLATMNFFVFNRTHLTDVLILLWIFLAPLEAVAGTRAAAAVFWISTLSGALLSALLVALPGHLLGWRPVPNLIDAADVGSSIGGIGAAGGLTVLCERWNRPLGWTMRLGLGLFLLAQLRTAPSIADVEHTVGYLIGIGVAYRLGLHRRDSPHPPTPSPNARRGGL